MPVKTALVLLTLALTFGLAVAPTAEAACPPTAQYVCPPGGNPVSCTVGMATAYANLVVRECL